MTYEKNDLYVAGCSLAKGRSREKLVTKSSVKSALGSPGRQVTFQNGSCGMILYPIVQDVRESCGTGQKRRENCRAGTEEPPAYWNITLWNGKDAGIH